MRTVKYCGKLVTIKGVVSAVLEDRVLITKMTVDGEPKHHAWINKAMDVKQGETISFRARSYEYIGLDEDCRQVKKIGYRPVNNKVVRKCM